MYIQAKVTFINSNKIIWGRRKLLKRIEHAQININTLIGFNGMLVILNTNIKIFLTGNEIYDKFLLKHIKKIVVKINQLKYTFLSLN